MCYILLCIDVYFFVDLVNSIVVLVLLVFLLFLGDLMFYCCDIFLRYFFFYSLVLWFDRFFDLMEVIFSDVLVNYFGCLVF